MSESTSRVFLYVQHLLGIGHLMRATRIASALLENGFEITLVTGGMPVEGLNTAGMDHVVLPPIGVSNGDFSQLLDAQGELVTDQYRDQRCQQLLDAYYRSKADIVILEAFPFGRRQVRFELLPLIDAVEASRPRPLLLSSIRDVLQRRSKPGRDEQTVQLVKQHFDKVLVHGDSSLITLDQSFPYAKQMVDKIIYTGLVCGSRPVEPSQQFDIVVSAGGGAVGGVLVNTAIDASVLLPDFYSWCVITGPNLSIDEFDSISKKAPGNVTVERFRSDFSSLLTVARLSISQAGYNTVNDVLQARCRSILVPYSAQGETEQADRAALLQKLELASVINSDSIGAVEFSKVVRSVLAQDPPPELDSIETQGAQNTAIILQNLLRER
ncbi:MAG: glycosyltransferase family protein [Granulosicoccus sp.]